MIQFKNLKELVDIVNSSLGGFCSEFQYTRKCYLGKERVNSVSELFKYEKEDRDWSINAGGGTEFQYHIVLRDGVVNYGLGFNAQYVPFNNDHMPVEYIRPYVKSYLEQPELEDQLLNAGCTYIYHDRDVLKNLQNNQYVLIGKQITPKKRRRIMRYQKANLMKCLMI